MTDEVLGRFRADLKVEPVVKDGAARAFRITDPVAKIEHTLTDVEYAVARELDGKRTAAAVAAAVAGHGVTVSASHVAAFARELEGMTFVLRTDDFVPAPPPLPPPPAPPAAAGDTAHLVEEAKRALAAGDLRAARDHIDAALALKSPPAMPAIESAALPPRTEEYPRILMTSPPPASTSSPPPAPAANVASPDAPTTSPTVERQPAADSTGIDIDVAEQLAPRRRGRRPLLLAAAVVVAAVAFVALSPTAPLHAFFVREPAAPVAEVPRPSPPPPAPATPPDAAPAPSPPAPSTPPPAPIPTPALVDAAKASAPATEAAAPETPAALDVVAPMRGKFAKVYVAKGVHVKHWQVLGLVVDVAGDKQAPLTAPGDGVFEAIVPLGSKLKKGDVVARVTPP